MKKLLMICCVLFVFCLTKSYAQISAPYGTKFAVYDDGTGGIRVDARYINRLLATANSTTETATLCYIEIDGYDANNVGTTLAYLYADPSNPTFGGIDYAQLVLTSVTDPSIVTIEVSGYVQYHHTSDPLYVTWEDDIDYFYTLGTVQAYGN